MIYLIVGPIGAGKSGHAMELVHKNGGIHFCVDQWIKKLFGKDMPEAHTFSWYRERILRCEEQIWPLALALSSVKVDVILDFGFITVEDRMRIIKKCQEFKLSYMIHFISADPETRWKRVEQRNLDKGSTFSNHISREIFLRMENMFEELNQLEKESTKFISPT